MPTPNDHLTNIFFIAGIISVSGAFFATQTARSQQFGFQMKMSKDFSKLIDLCSSTMGLTKKSKNYKDRRGHEVALLLIRSENELLNQVIPFMDTYLVGPKLKSYNRWKKLFHKFLSRKTSYPQKIGTVHNS